MSPNLVQGNQPITEEQEKALYQAMSGIADLLPPESIQEFKEAVLSCTAPYRNIYLAALEQANPRKGRTRWPSISCARDLDFCNPDALSIVIKFLTRTVSRSCNDRVSLASGHDFNREMIQRHDFPSCNVILTFFC